MATSTPNYNLEKPGVEEFYDVDVQNRNMDKIDTELKKVSNKLTDGIYQTPVINGTQIQIQKQSTDSQRLFFKLNEDLSGNITISLDNGATELPLHDLDGTQITQLDKGFVEVVADATFFTLRNKGGLSGSDKQALIDITNEAERNDSDLKLRFINDILAKDSNAGIDSSSTWQQVLGALSGMETGKKWATGTVTSTFDIEQFSYTSSGTQTSTNAVYVNGLDFIPSMVVLYPSDTYAYVVTTTYWKGRKQSSVENRNIHFHRESTSAHAGLVCNVDSPNTAYVDERGFRLPFGLASHEVNWIAFE